MKPASKHPAVTGGGKIGARLSRMGSQPPMGQTGGRGSYDVDDEVFFTRPAGGPHSGRVVAHGQHGCTVDDAGGQRHQVAWDCVLGLKGRKTFPARVVERGLSGAILEREDGSRFYVNGDVPVAEEPDALTLDESGEDELLQKAARLARLWRRIEQTPRLPAKGVPLLWSGRVS